MKCHVLSCGGRLRRAVRPGLSRLARALRPVSPPGRGGVGCSHACLLGGRGGTGSLFCARFACAGVRGRGRVSAPARFVRLIARARRRTHLARPFPPGSFSRPQPVAFCRNAERRPREPPLFTFILSHFASGQALLGTKNENIGYFSWDAGGTGQQRSGHRGGGQGHATQSRRMCGAGSPPGRVRLQSRRVIRPSTAGETVPEASTNSIAWAAIREASLVSRRRSASSNMA